MKTVHIFYNGEGLHFPQGNAWEKFKGLDSVRTFEICAESWERYGWEVKRLSTLENDFNPTPFLPDGECSKSFHWYPTDYWQFIAKAKQVAEKKGRAVFATIDIINHGFWTQNCPVPWKDAQCLSFQREHFSLGAFCADYYWLLMAEKILLRYDQGKLPVIRGGEYVSDETILREYLPGELWPVMTFANNTERQSYPLCHHSRSSVASVYERIPTS